MMKRYKTVALVGRPNVGKSRIFNRLSGTRRAIVHDMAGVTRDVNSIVVRDHYLLLDTGGIGLVVDMDHQKLIAAAEAQVWLAVETADLIVQVVDAREGLTPLDASIAERLRASGKPVLLTANKVDHDGMLDALDEFAALGLDYPIAISAEHGHRFFDLEKAIEDWAGPAPEADSAEAEHRIHVAFVGRPNVGKSSLCNALLESDRLVVSEVPGTTRDTVMLDLDYRGKDDQLLPFRLVDTAGLRQRKRVSHSVEYFSTVRTHHAIEHADIVFLVIDAQSGVSKQDKALAGEILEAGKCVALLVNKWDIAIDRFRAEQPDEYENMDAFRKQYAASALEELFFLPDSPVLFVSALRGFSIDRTLKVARALWETSGRQLPTPKVNQLIHDLMRKREPRYTDNKRFKAYYSVQTGVRPFTFRIFCNRAGKLEDSYRRYLQKEFIRQFRLSGCPIVFQLKGKEMRYSGPDAMPGRAKSGAKSKGGVKSKGRPGAVGGAKAKGAKGGRR